VSLQAALGRRPRYDVVNCQRLQPLTNDDAVDINNIPSFQVVGSWSTFDDTSGMVMVLLAVKRTPSSAD